jgi:hypothetical protein
MARRLQCTFLIEGLLWNSRPRSLEDLDGDSKETAIR